MFSLFPSQGLWNALRDVQTILDDVDRAVRHPLHAQHLPVNVWADDEQVVVSAAVPGIAADAIETSIERDELRIAVQAEPQEPEGAKVLRRERAAYRAERRIELPFPVDVERVEARCKDGVLVIAMPRAATDKPRRIAVQAD